MKKTHLIAFVVGLYSFILLFAAPATGENGIAVSKDGVPIAYSTYGNGTPALVFVHGWSCDSSFWREQIPYFQKNNQVITLDLGGHGQSGRERVVYSMESFGEDVAAVVKAVHADTVILIGHSMGGPVVLKAAETIPERVMAVVGIDTFQDLTQEMSPEQLAEFVQPFKTDFTTTTDQFVRGMFRADADPKIIDEVALKMSSASPEVGISAMEEMFKVSYMKAPPQINMPVWSLNADLWPTKENENKKILPQFTLRVIPGVGHFLMLETPEEFNRQLKDIVDLISTQTLSGQPVAN